MDKLNIELKMRLYLKIDKKLHVKQYQSYLKVTTIQNLFEILILLQPYFFS